MGTETPPGGANRNVCGVPAAALPVSRGALSRPPNSQALSSPAGNAQAALLQLGHSGPLPESVLEPPPQRDQGSPQPLLHSPASLEGPGNQSALPWPLIPKVDVNWARRLADPAQQPVPNAEPPVRMGCGCGGRPLRLCPPLSHPLRAWPGQLCLRLSPPPSSHLATGYFCPKEFYQIASNCGMMEKNTGEN